MKVGGRTLDFLDGLRGLAAFWVMVGHARWLLWEGYSQGYLLHPQLDSLPLKGLVYVFSIFTVGHQAVMLFFVLSGFVIHLRYSRELQAQPQTAHFDWLPFVYRRIKRLLPPLLFALILTFVLDSAGQSLKYSIYTQSTPYSLINTNVVVNHDFQTVIGNLAFLMTVFVPVWGTDGPLWSLMYEWWFYMAYPLFWFLSKKSILLATMVMLGLFALSIFTQVFDSSILILIARVFSAMIIWWLGALLADVYAGRLFIRLSYIAFLAITLPAVVIATTIFHIYIPDVFYDLLWGIGLTGVIAGLLAWKQQGRSLSILEAFKPLGDFSYTLYVTHFPILVFLSGFLLSRSPLLPRDFNWFVIGIIICLSMAYIAHLFVERPFVKRRIIKSVSQPELIKNEA